MRAKNNATLFAAITLAAAPLTTHAVLWDGNQPVDGTFDGIFATPDDWVGNIAPTAADAAEFTIPGQTYTVTFDSDPTTDKLKVQPNTSDVTFTSAGATQTYTVTNTVEIEASPLRLDTLHLSVGDGIVVTSNGDFEVVNDSTVEARNFSIGQTTDGNMLVSGPGSRIKTTSGDLAIGKASAGGSVTAELGANIEVAANVAIALGSGPAQTTGTLNVITDADVTTSGSIQIANADNHPLDNGQLFISGAGSTFTQTGANDNVIGGFTDSFGEIGVGNGATLTTGTGSTKFNNLSSLTVSDATYIANGTVQFDDAIVNIQNDSNVIFNSKLIVTPPTAVDFTGGTIRIDGSTANADIQDPAFEYAGTTGTGPATLGVSNGADATFAGTLLISNLAGSDSTLNAAGALAADQSTITTADKVNLGTNGKATLNVTNGALTEIGEDLNAGVLVPGQGAINVGTAAAGFEAQLDVARHLSLGGDPNVPGGAGSLTITPGGVVNVGTGGTGGVTRVYDSDELHVNGGRLNTIDLIFDPLTPVFDFTAGNININGGQFLAPTDTVTIQGPASPNQPVLSFNKGAQTTINADLNIADDPGSFGRVVVDGVDGSPSTVATVNIAVADPDIHVGLEGKGSLVVTNGALVSAGDDIIFGQATGASGTGQVSGVDGANRSTIITTGASPDSDIIVGASAEGFLFVTDGALAQPRRDLSIGADGGASGTATVGGAAGGFNAEIIAPRHINVGGAAGVDGDTGVLQVNPQGKATATDTLEIFPKGTVNLDGGKIVANKIEHTHGGTFNFNTGGLSAVEINGSITNVGGTLDPGHSPGTTDINGNYTQLTDGVTRIEVLPPSPLEAKPDPGTDYDQVNITKTATFGGSLNVIPTDGADPITDTPLGTLYTIITYGERDTSMFDQINGTLVNTTFALAPLFRDTEDADDNDDTLFLRASIPGDLNLDNKVSVADLSTFALNFNTSPGLYVDAEATNSWELGDFNTDGAITVADLSLLALNFGFDAADPTATLTPLSLQTAAAIAGIDLASIPEPTTIYITITATLLTTTRRPTRKTTQTTKAT